MLAYFHLDAYQALAFGDSYNDMEMLQTVGTGVAMGNAPEEIKAIADEVCGHVSEDGIYHYCVNHGLIRNADA
jgi:hydroxymethylpyrimidine pyrophosphatase-like HAD family hydrolase